MSKLKTSILVGVLSFGGFCVSPLVLANGDTLRVNQQSGQMTDKPRSGLSMQQVEDKFGSPNARAAAVGEPPITRWVYGEFTVYFEHDRVIHAVAHRS